MASRKVREKLSKCIYIYLLYLYVVSLSRYYFCTYDKAPTAPDCRHAERNPFVRLLKGGGLTSEGNGFLASRGRKMRSSVAQVASERGDGAGAAERKETSWVWRSIDSHYVDGKKTHTMRTTIYPRTKINKQVGWGYLGNESVTFSLVEFSVCLCCCQRS